MSPPQIALELAPRGGPAGTRVQVRVLDVTGRTPILLGFGGIGSPHEILGEQVTDDDGLAEFQVTIPSWVEADRTYLFYVAYADQRPVRFSDPFLATAEDGSVRLSGTVRGTSSCLVLDVGEAERFALLGVPTRRPPPGTQASVVATLAAEPGCEGLLALQVSSIEAAGGAESPA
ncbi:MAG: hypothetical protein R3E10_12120 [Gemmatimonadota bacterium]